MKVNEQEVLIADIIDWFNNSSEQVYEYTGAAGTGKTHVMKEVVSRLGLHSYEVAPMAYVGAAAIVLRMKGLTSAKTIHSWIYKATKVRNTDSIYQTSLFDNQETQPTSSMGMKFIFCPKTHLDGIRLILIDEGSQVPMSMKKDLLNLGIKILVAGDINQLHPVMDKPAFLNGDNKIFQLTELHRQDIRSGIVYLAHQILEGKPLEPGLYGNAVVLYRDEISKEQLLEGDIILTGLNETREKINKTIRHDLLNINIELPTNGEKMICRQNNWFVNKDGISLANGLCGKVINYPGLPTMIDNKTFLIDFQPYGTDTVFKNVKTSLPYLRANVNERRIMKQTNYWDGNKFEFAYSITTHLSQGSQYKTGFYIQEKLAGNDNKNLDYTGITRFSEFCTVIIPRQKYF